MTLQWPQRSSTWMNELKPGKVAPLTSNWGISRINLPYNGRFWTIDFSSSPHIGSVCTLTLGCFLDRPGHVGLPGVIWFGSLIVVYYWQHEYRVAVISLRVSDLHPQSRCHQETNPSSLRGLNRRSGVNAAYSILVPLAYEEVDEMKNVCVFFCCVDPFHLYAQKY